MIYFTVENAILNHDNVVSLPSKQDIEGLSHSEAICISQLQRECKIMHSKLYVVLFRKMKLQG